MIMGIKKELFIKDEGGIKKEEGIMVGRVR